MAKNENCCNDKNPFVAIPASLMGIFLALCVLFLIFAKESLGLLIPIVWAFVVLGIVAMVLFYNSVKKKK